MEKMFEAITELHDKIAEIVEKYDVSDADVDELDRIFGDLYPDDEEGPEAEGQDAEIVETVEPEA